MCRMAILVFDSILLLEVSCFQGIVGPEAAGKSQRGPTELPPCDNAPADAIDACKA